MANSKGDITTRFSVDISDLKKGISEANQQIKLANAQFKAASAGMDDWAKSTEGVKAKLSQMDSVLSAQRTKVAAYKEELLRTQQAYDENGKRAAELRAKLEQLAANGVAKTSAEYKKYENELAAVEKEQAKNEKSINDLNVTILNQEAAASRTEKEIRDYNNILNDLEKEEQNADEEAKDLAKSTVNAGESAKKAEGGFTVLKGALASLAADAAKAAARAMVDLGKSAINAVKDVAVAGDEIDKNSQKVGMSAQAYQEWDYAMKIAGTDMASSSAGFKTLNNNFDKAINGSDSAAEKFKRLGLSLTDLKGMSREEIFAKTIEALQGVSDESEKAALASQLLGKAGTNLMPLLNQTAEETQGLIDEAREYGLVMSDDAVEASAKFQDTLTLAKGAATGLKNALIGELLPGISGVVQGFVDLVKGNEGANEAISKGIDDLINGISTMTPKIISLFETLANALITAAPGLIDALLKGILSALPSLIASLTSVLPVIISSLSQAILGNLPLLVSVLLQAATQLIAQIGGMLPDILTLLVSQTIPDLVTAILEALPSLLQAVISVAQALVSAAPQIISLFVGMLPQLIDSIVDFLIGNLPVLIEAAYQLLMSLILAIPQIQAAVMKEFPKILTSIVKALGKLVVLLPQLFKKAWNGIKKAFSTSTVGKYFKKIWENIKKAFAKVGSWFKDKFKKAWEGIKNAFSKVGAFFSGIWSAIKHVFEIIPQWFRNKFLSAVKKIKEVFRGIVTFFGDIWTKIKEKFTDLGTKIGDAISGAVKTGINGVIGLVENAINGAIGLINGAIGLINKIPGVSIGTISTVSFPRLEQGGILKKGQWGFIEGSGDEAVVPLHKNKAWIAAVAQDMARQTQNINSSIVNNSKDYNFTQIINAPKQPSRLDLYRQTRALLSAKARA